MLMFGCDFVTEWWMEPSVNHGNQPNSCQQSPGFRDADCKFDSFDWEPELSAQVADGTCYSSQTAASGASVHEWSIYSQNCQYKPSPTDVIFASSSTNLIKHWKTKAEDEE